MEESDRIVELQEKLSESLLAVSQKRSDVPDQCAKLLHQNLQLKHLSAEKVIFLPKKSLKKFACKYPLDKSVEETFNLETKEESAKEISSLISQFRENQLNLLKVINMTNLKRSSQDTD